MGHTEAVSALLDFGIDGKAMDVVGRWVGWGHINP
jgi:hypothetical protein